MPLASNVQTHLLTILNALINLQTPSSAIGGRRAYSALFQELPSPTDYPDYYVYIKEPRSLNGVLASLKKGTYSSPQAIAYDLFLIWNNARQYNQQGSIVYADADKLETCMQDLWNGRSPPLPAFHSLPRPGSLPSAHASTSKSSRPEGSSKKSKKIKLGSSSLQQSTPSASHSTPSGQSTPIIPIPRISIAPKPITSTATPAPPAASTSTAGTGTGGLFKIKIGGPKFGHAASGTPSTPAGVAQSGFITPSATLHRPPSTSSIILKRPAFNASAPASTSAASAASPHSFAFGSGTSNSPKKELRKDQRIREKAAKAQMRMLRDGPSGMREEGTELDLSAGPTTDDRRIADVEPGWFGGDFGGREPSEVYVEIVEKLKTKTDANGRILATPLISVPDRATRPDYYAVVTDPTSLDIVQSRAESDYYRDPQEFDKDLLHVFTTAKIFIRPSTPGTYWGDLLQLQQLYQQLTQVAHASTQPNSAVAALSQSSNTVILGSPMASTSSPGKVDLTDRVFLEGISFKGEVYRVGDWVHVFNPENAGRPIIGQIFKAWKKPDSPQRSVTVCWYYRPEETIHQADREFYESEVFKTNIFQDHPIEDVLERCFVMSHFAYIRGRPNTPLYNSKMALYVCEHRYKPSTKSFKRIKIWAVCGPEETRKNDYPLKENAGGAVESLAKIPSPFVRGLQGPGGIGNAEEEEEEDQEGFYTEKEKGKANANAAAAALTNGGMMGGMGEMDFGMFDLQLQPNGAVGGQLTPADLAVLNEAFNPLPDGIASQFRTDEDGDLLWFTAPPVGHTQRKKPVKHSMDYLYWKAMESRKRLTRNGTTDIEMA